MSRRADKEAAAEKYEEFHRYPPTKIGEFADGFSIPKSVVVGGKALWITYRSGKVDPATLRKPRSPVDYIHEFNAGVVAYLASGKGKRADVPGKFREVAALTKLGENLGFCFEDGDEAEVEAVSTRPMPELYATPDGKCLIVVQDKRRVIAMFWGGALGVFARGIDG